jgi:hypothetical protein
MRCKISLRTRIRVWDKLKNRYVHFESTVAGMRTRDKFKNWDDSVGQA